MMKWLPILAMLPAASVAFQQAAPFHYRTGHHEETLDRAEQCATLYDFCDIDELETLRDDLAQFQSNVMPRVQGRDHKKVYEILRSQSELKRMMEGLAADELEEDIFHDYLHYHW